MKAARLRDRIELWKPAAAVADELNQNEPQYSLFRATWCEHFPLSVSEQVKLGALSATSTARFTIRFIDGIDSSFVIKFRNKVWKIQSTAEVVRREVIEILASLEE